MSKKNNGNFNNKAAKRFKQPDRIDTMEQEDIFEILDEDIGIILGQITANRDHYAPFPQYIMNAFANLSTPLWFNEYVKEHVKVKKCSGKKKKYKIKTDLTDDEIESLKTILSGAFKRSVTNQFPNQTQEFKERNKIIGETFKRLEPNNYYLAKKLNGGTDALDERELRELVIQVYGNPVSNAKFVHRLFNLSPLPDKKKLKIMKQMYGKKRFVKAAGAMLTVTDNNSDCIEMIYQYIKDLKTKKRAPYILEYARAYKENKSSNFRLSAEGKFYKKNKKLIKELIECDIGFKKAFKNLKGKKDKTKDKPKKNDKKVGFTMGV